MAPRPHLTKRAPSGTLKLGAIEEESSAKLFQNSKKMTQSTNALIDALVIPDGAANSNAISTKDFGDAVALYIYGPAAIVGGGTLSFQASRDGSNWVTCNDGSADIGPPAATKGRQYSEFQGALYLRIHGTSVVTGDTTWLVSKSYTA